MQQRTDALVKIDQTMQLAGGRTLGFAEYGSAEGQVLVYCQGYPGSRLEAAAHAAHAAHAALAALAALAAAAHVRVLRLDRPGYGRSSFQQRRSFLDWPADLVALTDHVGIERFAVLGASGGAPYALACADRLAERLLACGVVSGLGPLPLGTDGMSRQNRLVLSRAHRAPWLLTPRLRATARSFRDAAHASKAVTKAMKGMVKPDREALLAQGFVDPLAASTRETYRQGVRGAVYEGRLYGRDWGLGIPAGRRNLPAALPLAWCARYHRADRDGARDGALDTTVPIGMARGMARGMVRSIPPCRSGWRAGSPRAQRPTTRTRAISRRCSTTSRSFLRPCSPR